MRKIPIININNNQYIIKELSQHSDDIINYIISAVEHGIKNKLLSVSVFMIKFKDNETKDIKMILQKSDWGSALEKILTKCVDKEYYEKAHVIKNLLDVLKI